MVAGTPGKLALLTGNGGVEGDLILGDHSKIAAGNSPGQVTVSGNLVMYSGSIMEVLYPLFFILIYFYFCMFFILNKRGLKKRSAANSTNTCNNSF